MKHCMLDLETLGTKPGCVVLSIGACAFDPVTGTIGDTFYEKLSWKNQSLKIEPGTLEWWLDQDPAVFREARSGDTPLFDAAVRFKSWCDDRQFTHYWAHSPSFDCAVWEAAAGIVPWRYNNQLCTRTIYQAAGITPARDPTTHHNALQDAIAQAKAVCAAYAKLGLQQDDVNRFAPQ